MDGLASDPNESWFFCGGALGARRWCRDTSHGAVYPQAERWVEGRTLALTLLFITFAG